MQKTNPVGWFDIYVNNMERAVLFYETMLELKLEPIEDATGQMQLMGFPFETDTYGTGGALCKTSEAKPGAGGTTIYFMVDDCAIQQERVIQAGGTVIKPKFSIGKFGWILFCQDTEGNIIGFNSKK